MKRLLATVALVLAAGGCLSATAFGSDSRAEFIDQAERVCDAGSGRTAIHLLRGEEALYYAKYDFAARQFRLAAKGSAWQLRRLRRLEPPLTDVSRIEKWLGWERARIRFTKRRAGELKKRKLASSERLAYRMYEQMDLIRGFTVGYGLGDCF